MSEADLERSVRELLTSNRLYGYHAHDSRRDRAGFPDWVVIGRRGVLFRELKSEAGTLTAEQTTVRYLLIAAGADWGLWRPVDLRSGRIARELSTIT